MQPFDVLADPGVQIPSLPQDEIGWILFEPLVPEPFMKFRNPLPDLGVGKPSHPPR